MKKFKSIVAIALLGIFGVVVLHNITPHFDCETYSTFTSYEGSHHEHTGIHHNHQEEQHEQVHEELNSNWFEDLLGLLGGLEHHELGAGHFENFTAQSENFILNSSIQNSIDLPSSAIFKNFITPLSSEVEVNFEGPPIFYEQHYRGSSPLRGPPSLV